KPGGDSKKAASVQHWHRSSGDRTCAADVVPTRLIVRRSSVFLENTAGTAYVRRMSRAFTREDDSDGAIADIGERPVSTHRNLVTPQGLEAIDAEVSSLRAELAKAESEGERERIALLSRDLRYWNSRRETAEVSIPEAKS